MSRLGLTHARDPLCAEQTHTANLGEPSAVTDSNVFALVATPTADSGVRPAAPRYLEILVRLTHTSNVAANISIWFFDPNADTAGRWFQTVETEIKRDSDDTHGMIQKIDVPSVASHARVGISNYTAGNIYFSAYGDN